MFVKVHDVLECFWMPSGVRQGCVRLFGFRRVSRYNSGPKNTAHIAALSQARDNLPSNMLLWLREMRGVL